MQKTLYVTQMEFDLFKALPETLRQGWQAVAETMAIADDPESRQIRIQFMRLRDPRLQEVQKKASSCRSIDEFLDVLKGADFSKVRSEDQAEFFFALGPEVITGMVLLNLAAAKSDEDILKAASLSSVRHMLLTAQKSVR